MPLHGSVLSPRFDSTHIKDAKNKLRFFFGSWATKEQKHQLQSVTFVLSESHFSQAKGILKIKIDYHL